MVFLQVNNVEVAEMAAIASSTVKRPLAYMKNGDMLTNSLS